MRRGLGGGLDRLPRGFRIVRDLIVGRDRRFASALGVSARGWRGERLPVFWVLRATPTVVVRVRLLAKSTERVGFGPREQSADRADLVLRRSFNDLGREVKSANRVCELARLRGAG